MTKARCIIFTVFFICVILTGCNHDNDVVKESQTLQTSTSIEQSSETSKTSDSTQQTIEKVSQDNIIFDKNNKYPQIEIPQYTKQFYEPITQYRELDISEFEVAIGPANDMLLCYDFTGNVLDEYTYQSLDGTGDYYTNEVCEADVYLYNCLTDEKTFIMKSTLTRYKDYTDSFSAYAEISLDDKSFWIIDMLTFDNEYQNRYLPHDYKITCVDTITKSYKENNYTINGIFTGIIPFDNTNFILAVYGNHMEEPLPYKDMYYRGNINSNKTKTLYINDKETGEIAGDLCTDKTEIINHIFDYDNEVYFSSIIKKDGFYIISVKCINKDGQISKVGQPFYLPLVDDEDLYIGIEGCIANKQIYLTPYINQGYSNYLLCINSENKSYIIDNHRKSRISSSHINWTENNYNSILLTYNTIIEVYDYFNEYQRWNTDIFIPIKIPHICNYCDETGNDSGTVIFDFKATSGFVFKTYDENYNMRVYYITRKQIEEVLCNDDKVILK